MTIIDMTYPDSFNASVLIREWFAKLFVKTQEAPKKKIADVTQNVVRSEDQVMAVRLRQPREIAGRIELSRSDYSSCIR